jgi:hypothetical protein
VGTELWISNPQPILAQLSAQAKMLLS